MNYTPSFSTDTPLDSLIKKNAIRDTLRLLNLTDKIKNDIKVQRDKDVKERLTTGKRKKWTDEERVEMGRLAQQERDIAEDSNLGGFQKIYPLDDAQVRKYQRFFQHAHELEGQSFPGGSSTLIPPEKKEELQKQLMKTFQPSEPSNKLRKNTSVKMKANR